MNDLICIQNMHMHNLITYNSFLFKHVFNDNLPNQVIIESCLTLVVYEIEFCHFFLKA